MKDTNQPKAVVVVDSDGCVLDSMEDKHRKAFFPALDAIWRFGTLKEEAKDVWMNINLYSEFRGSNRFLALLTFFNTLQAMPRSQGYRPLPDTAGLRNWINSALTLSETDLVAGCETASGDALHILRDTLRWTREVNRIVNSLPEPAVYPGASETLEIVQQHAIPLFVASSANRTAIESDWAHAGIDHLVSGFFGQEDGTKAEILRRIGGDRGSGNRVIMIGDSPGDEEAAMEAGTCFFPIIPGMEAQSWLDFQKVVLPQFLGDGFSPAILKPYVEIFFEVLQRRFS